MSEFTEYLGELLADFGDVSFRRMFGGYGVFRDGVMFALVAKDSLYLKSDAQSEPAFCAQDLKQFEYQRGAKTVAMSYLLAPEEALDDSEALHDWAMLAYESALRFRR